jgi:hypothetical protein
MRQLIIGERIISDDSDAYVIAEIGHNHQGSVKTAKELFQAAAECGVDAGKLQKRDNRSLYTREMFDKPYDNENSFGATYGEHREALEFGKAEYEELQGESARLGIAFFSTAFDMRSADFLAELKTPGLQDRVRRSEEHPAVASCREDRQADDRQHRRRHHGRCAEGVRGDHADQPASLPDAVHVRLSGGVRRARPAGDRDVSREVPGGGHRLLRA